MTAPLHHYIVTVTCKDQPGIVHALTGAVVEAEGNITELQQFSSPESNTFFLRLQVETGRSRLDLQTSLEAPASRFGMELSIVNHGAPMRTLILGSTATHCLHHLLSRKFDGHLNIDVPLILSNHTSLQELATFFRVPFRHVPIGSASDKRAFEQILLELVEEHDVELVVLARFMQVLSEEMCERLQGRAINIHHSFLPGFKGAHPYAQAHSRGVKLIGATAHFVTPELDEGPIIEQNVVRVDHSQSVKALQQTGQDVESHTLTQAVQWFSEHRILLDGQRTVIFR